MARYIVGISGASGIILGLHTICALAAHHEIELVFTQAALYTASLELGKEFKSGAKIIQRLPKAVQNRISLHSIHDMGCAIASGSYPIAGMVIVPCSMTTLAALSVGLSDTLLRRAADVTLKEKRPLTLVPRETPLSTLHLENLLKLSRLGVTILPPIPAWYTEPKTVEEIELFIVGKILESFGLEHNLYKRWNPN
jgi:flavin prenyltransferase